MRPETIGRTLGIGLRVAGRIVGQSIAATTQPATAASVTQTTAHPGVSGAAGKGASGCKEGTARGSVARGVGGFLRPFVRVGGILWLEITGAFFLLFALVSGMAMWRTRPSSLNGPYDKNFLAAAGILVVFFYLGVSSFWRARRR